MVEVLFFISVFSIFFTYFGYPLTLILVAQLRRKDVLRMEYLPTVTFVVTVHNEENRIREKLDNILLLDYPREKLQILVASDGSNDGTNQIISEYCNRGIELIEMLDRRGKENAQKEVLKNATGEVIVFSDVATTMETGGLRQLISSFADPSVGCVSSKDQVLGRDGKPSGEGLYVRYEMWLRYLESRANSLVGLSGSLFAARKEVCQDFSGEMQSDFRTVLNSVKMGLRGISDPLAIGIYKDIADQKRERERKIRTVLRGLTVFFNHLDLLNIFQYGLFSYQLFCHKLLRWLVPFFLILVFAFNILLIFESVNYIFLMLLQTLFYSIGILGLIKRKIETFILIKIPTYFIEANMSILFAWWQYLRGKRIVTWSPTIR